MSTKLVWQLIALSFALIIIGIFVAVDVDKVVGVVILIVGLGPGVVARLAHENQRKR